MKVYINPQRSEWPALLGRPAMDTMKLQTTVRNILNQVKENGDQALRKYTAEFDKVTIEDLLVTEAEINKAKKNIPTGLKRAIKAAAANIRRFHKSQITKTKPVVTTPGVICWRKSVPIEKVGLYIPGGTAPLFSTVLMLGIPAQLAGCKEIILCTPPSPNEKTREASIHPAILFAASIAGITKIYKVGGAQAIAAMSYGTETIPAVYKIFGPGNQYVNCAKQLVQMDGLAIDMPAGPSEVCILADETANPAFVSADLLSQAEHGIDSQVLLVATSESIVKEVIDEISVQMQTLSRSAIMETVIENSNAVIFDGVSGAMDFINEYAPEHLILACNTSVVDRIISAGSVFIGNYSPESAGDYASGTNHTLPTNGFARSHSGLSVDSFVKNITFQSLSKEGLQSLGETVITMANAEGLDAHAHAVSIRLKKMN